MNKETKSKDKRTKKIVKDIQKRIERKEHKRERENALTPSLNINIDPNFYLRNHPHIHNQDYFDGFDNDWEISEELYPPFEESYDPTIIKQAPKNTFKQASKNTFKINDYLELKLESFLGDWHTNIYVNGNYFMQCKYLLLNIPKKEREKTFLYHSIDEMEDIYNKDHETNKEYIDPETEFFGHCSNLQAWYEYNYDTRLLHRNLAFPLLKKLTDASDSLAKKVFKEEIAKRIIEGDSKGRIYLIKEGYLQYLTKNEISIIKDAFKEQRKALLSEIVSHFKKYLREPRNVYFINQLRSLPSIIPTTLYTSLKSIYPSLIFVSSENLHSFEPSSGDYLFLSNKGGIIESEKATKNIRRIEDIINASRLMNLKIFLYLDSLYYKVLYRGICLDKISQELKQLNLIEKVLHPPKRGTTPPRIYDYQGNDISEIMLPDTEIYVPLAIDPDSIEDPEYWTRRDIALHNEGNLIENEIKQKTQDFIDSLTWDPEREYKKRKRHNQILYILLGIGLIILLLTTFFLK